MPSTSTFGQSLDDALPDLPLDSYFQQNVYHKINTDFPGVQLVCEHPFIFVVHDFVSAMECDQLIEMLTSGFSQPSATAPAQEELRTSTSVFPTQGEVQWLRERIALLTNTCDSQLEPTKLTKYTDGQYFRKHTDASFLHEKMWAYSARLAEVDEDGIQGPCEWPSRFVVC